MTCQNKNRDLKCLKIRGGRSRTRRVSRHKSRNGNNDNVVFNFACINIGMYFILYQCMKQWGGINFIFAVNLTYGAYGC